MGKTKCLGRSLESRSCGYGAFILLCFVVAAVVFLSADFVYGGGPGVEGSVSGGDGLTIASIQTAGNHSISSSQILSKVRSRVGDLFEAATASEDARRIAQLSGIEYGYYNTTIVDGKIRLTFVVIEKNIVRSIVFIGNRKYGVETLEKKVGFRVADYLDTILAESGRISLVEFYQKNGFDFVKVTLDTGRLSLGEVVYTIDEGPRVRIESVKFVGNRAVKTRTLKKGIKTKNKKFLFWPGYYNQQRLDMDVVKLHGIYQKKGFLDTKINVKRRFNEDKTRVVVVFAIEEGAVYTVEKIVVVGSEHFEKGYLAGELKLKEGQVFIERKAASDVKRFIELYHQSGFIDVKVKYNRRFISGNSVAVEFEIEEGQRFRIGRVNITGNVQTQDKVIRRVLDEYDFRPGQWYNMEAARGDGDGELEKMIRSMALAESATITPSGDVPGQKDAQVSIVEGQTGMVMIGAGVASDSGVIGQLTFEQRNFDISDTPESFTEFITGRAFKGAGQDFRIALQPGTEVSEYSVSFSDPYFKDKPVTLDVVGSSYERERESYEEGRLKGYVGFERRYRSKWRASAGFRLEDVDVQGIDYDAPKEIKDVKGSNLLAGLRLGVGKNLTDDRFNPTSGYSCNAGYEQVTGDHTFGVLSGTYRQYRTIYEDLAERKTVLAAKLHAATTIGDAPPFEKFYGGGSNSIRGFDYRGVSTRGRPTNSTSTRCKDPIGSDWIFLANAEVTVPLVSNNFAALFFIDSGTIDSGSYRAALGTGIQILIPQWFGPVPMRFEFAAPLMKDNEDETQTFSFSIGRLF